MTSQLFCQKQFIVSCKSQVVGIFFFFFYFSKGMQINVKHILSQGLSYWKQQGTEDQSLYEMYHDIILIVLSFPGSYSKCSSFFYHHVDAVIFFQTLILHDMLMLASLRRFSNKSYLVISFFFLKLQTFNCIIFLRKLISYKPLQKGKKDCN